MRLREAFEVLLEFKSQEATAEVRAKVNGIIDQIDQHLISLENSAEALKIFSLQAMEKEIPFIGKEAQAKRLLKALHCVQDARTLSKPD